MRRVVIWLLFSALCGSAAVRLPAQDATRLQRDQNEILRKAERLRGLMESLLDRYEKEGRTEQVRLLREGLKHLDASGLLSDVAEVRTNLDAGAVAEAMRKQREVVADLEALLDILLERRSVEALDEEIARTEELLRGASELAERQRELQEQTAEASEGQADAAERELADALGALARESRREAEENLRQAGVERPLLEAAIDNLERLLEQQGRLEQQVTRERAGDPASDPVRQRGFALGELETESREAQGDVERQRQFDRAARAAEDLQRALQSGDRARAEQQRDRLQAALTEAGEMRSADADEDAAARREARELAEQLAQAGTENQPSLEETAERVRAAMDRRADEARERAAQRWQQLAEEARALAERMRSGEAAESDPAAASQLEAAAEAFEKAAESDRSQSSRALSEASEAARRVAEARRQFRARNPDAAQRAAQMSAEADRTSRSLRNAAADPEATESQAAGEVETARDALRDLEERLERSAGTGEPADPEALDQGLEQSRESLEAALERLEGALQAANEGRERPLEAAQARQAELTAQAEALRERLQRSAQSGALSEEQRGAAERAMQDAESAMQQASSDLARGQQANAANQQQRAADALEQARRGLQENRPLSDEQRAALQALAEEQQRLQEDVIRLAELVEERKNREASEALQQAAAAAQRAAEALEQGDAETAEREQERAREELERAQQALEQERDRYQDLRQEELLFRIQEELNRFLETQEPITRETAEAGTAIAEGRRLTRPMRRSLNGLAETERELAGRLKFIHEALAEEGTLVFTHVLSANETDLVEVAGRLSGREPDPGEYTVLLQREVEERTRRLLDALDRERQRRREEAERRRREQQEGQQPQGNQFGPQRERLVPIVSELLMLRQMEEEMIRRTRELETMIDVAGEGGITDVEAAMAERLAHQHNALTRIFEQIKAQLEQALTAGEEQGGGDGR